MNIKRVETNSEELTELSLFMFIQVTDIFTLPFYIFFIFLDVEEQKIWLFAYGLNKSFQKMERRMEIPSVQDIQRRIHEEV